MRIDLLLRLNVRIDLLLTCGQHLHDSTILIRGEVLREHSASTYLTIQCKSQKYGINTNYKLGIYVHLALNPHKFCVKSHGWLWKEYPAKSTDLMHTCNSMTLVCIEYTSPLGYNSQYMGSSSNEWWFYSGEDHTFSIWRRIAM